MIGRVELERRIAEERMHEIEPHGTPPEWLGQFDIDQPRVWTMDAEGRASSSWTWLDSVGWHDVVAVRMEWPHGHPIDPADLGDDGDYGW